MKALIRISLLLICVIALVFVLVLFWDSNAGTEVTPKFVAPWFGISYQVINAPWPLSLALMVAFFAGAAVMLLGTWIAALGFLVRMARYRKEIRNLRKEVESLRVSDLDEEVGREMSWDAEEEDDEVLGETRQNVPHEPPVSLGAAATYAEEGDDEGAETRVGYEGLMPSGDRDEDPADATRKQAERES